MSTTKDVRTLTICKVNPNWSLDPHTQTDYKEIYKGLLRRANVYRFLSLGGPDAICIHKPNIPATNNQWLKGVLSDKKQILSEITPDISYHPIHIVSDLDQNEFWRNLSGFPFLFVSFLYGVDSFKETLKQIQTLFPKGKQQHAVYHSIDICDLVVLTASKTLGDTLERLSTIDKKGFARRIYTTVNLPLEAGVISSAAQTALQGIREKMGVIIQGSIRAIKDWQKVLEKEAKDLDLSPKLQYGTSDFTITGDLAGKDLAELLSYFLENSTAISKACWDIHTEILSEPKPKEEGSGPTSIPQLIKPEYLRLCDIAKDGNVLKQQPWYSDYLEMMLTQMNIDRHPLFTGPTTMFFDGIHAVNSVFCDCETPDDNIDINDPATRIADSQLSIERFIRCTNQLAEQLTRNDDVLFHGIGSSPVVASAIPDMILEFYHAFFRKLADYLTKLDSNKMGKESPFEYGFILAPKLNERMRISPVLQDKCKYKKIPKGAHLLHWPNKQAFVIQFPADDIYKPINCFLPLAHECFHYFGDGVRMRSARFIFMAHFVATTFLTSIGMNSSRNTSLLDATLSIITRAPDSIDINNVYDEEAKYIFNSKLQYLFTQNGYKELYNLSGQPYYMYSKEVLDRWLAIKLGQNNVDDENPDPISIPITYINACSYFFRECHADILAIDVLGIEPSEYLNQILLEFKSLDAIKNSESAEDIHSQQLLMSQRIAIVLATYYLPIDSREPNVWSEKDEENCSILLSAADQEVGTCAKDMIFECFSVLTKQSAYPPDSDSRLPADALMTVVDYLCIAREYLYIQSSKPANIAARNKLKETYDKVIRSCDVFGDEFFQIIKEHRDEVQARSESASK